jgi:hypothetical protein
LDGGSACRKAATYTQNKRTQTSMPRVVFELRIQAFKRAKSVHAPDRAATKLPPQIIYNSTLTQKHKIPGPLSQATVSNHPNVFTFTLPLSEEREGESLEPSNKMKLLFHNKMGCISSYPSVSLFNYSFTIPSYPSLSPPSGFQQFMQRWLCDARSYKPDSVHDGLQGK